MSDPTVYKYALRLGDPTTLPLPESAEVLHFDVQDGLLYMWALVHPDRATEDRHFEVHGTGHRIPAVAYDEALLHRGTALSKGFVWHLFERSKGMPF